MYLLKGPADSQGRILVERIYNLEHPANAGVDTTGGVITMEPPAPPVEEGFVAVVHFDTVAGAYQYQLREIPMSPQLMQQAIDILMGDDEND